jgi:hypothetical protein
MVNKGFKKRQEAINVQSIPGYLNTFQLSRVVWAVQTRSSRNLETATAMKFIATCVQATYRYAHTGPMARHGQDTRGFYAKEGDSVLEVLDGPIHMQSRRHAQLQLKAQWTTQKQASSQRYLLVQY